MTAKELPLGFLKTDVWKKRPWIHLNKKSTMRAGTQNSNLYTFDCLWVYFGTEWQNLQWDSCIQRKLRSACPTAQSDQSLWRSHVPSAVSGLYKEYWTRTFAIISGYTSWSVSVGYTGFIVGFDVRLLKSEKISMSKLQNHYENTSIQIHGKFHLQKTETFQIKNQIFFIFLLKI